MCVFYFYHFKLLHHQDKSTATYAVQSDAMRDEEMPSVRHEEMPSVRDEEMPSVRHEEMPAARDEELPVDSTTHYVGLQCSVN